MSQLSIFSAAALVAVGALQGAHAASYEYVGSWAVPDGPRWTTNPPVYSGQEAAALLFGGAPGDYVISTVSANPADINNLAYLDGWADSQFLSNPQPEDWKLDVGNPGYNDPGGTGTAYSAYVSDHSCASCINYAFRIIAGGMPMTFMPLMMEGSTRNRLDTLYQRRERVAGGDITRTAMVNGGIQLAAADTTRSDADTMGNYTAQAGYGLFVEARYSDFERSANADGNGLNGSGRQLTIGYDQRLKDGLMAGVALGYDDLNGNSLITGNTADGDVYNLSVYGRYTTIGWFADAVLGYAYGDFDTKSNGNSGDTNTDQYFAEIRAGTRRNLEYGVQASPFAGLRYTHNSIDGYSEQGAGGNSYAGYDSDSAYALLGVGLDFGTHANNGWLIRPSLDITFSKRLTGENDEVTYLDTSGSFQSASSLAFDEYAASFGAHLELQRSDSYSLMLGINLARGSEESTDKSAYLGVNIPL